MLMTTMRVFTTLVSLFALSVCGCNLHSVEATAEYPDSTVGITHPEQLLQADRTLHPIDRTQTPGSEKAATCQPDTGTTRVRHIVVADIDYIAHTVSVQQRIRFTNNTDAELEQIAFNIEAIRLPGAFALDQVASGMHDRLTYTFRERQLEVTLPEILAPGCEVSITLGYRLDVPAVGERTLASKGFFGYTDRQLNLGHWLATVATFQDGAWVTREASVIGEQDVLDRADWEVTANLINPPHNLTIAAPGIVTQVTPTHWRFVHPDSRDFSMSLSHAYIVLSRETDTGVTVEVYAFDNTQENTAAEHALDMATRSVVMFSDLFGPYPYGRLVVVQGDFPDGMEFSGLVFVGNHWYTQYTGDPDCYLTLITVHEVSHQWWYARVGSDSALHPWLDEALATYSEYIFIEEYYPALKDWWWHFRVSQYNPSGYVDDTVYEFDSARAYINAVYLRGVEMMHALRQDLGTEAFFQLLADYVEAGDGRIATPDLFWSLLTPEQIEWTQQTREEFLREPDVGGRG